jgi:subtilisin family serine protease
MLVGNIQAARQTVTDAAGRAWHSIFGDRPQAEVGSRAIVVLSSPSLADRIEAASGKVGAAKQRQWVAEIEAEQDAFLASLRERGVAIEREQIFTKTLNGFSATLDARAVAELDRNPSVIGVYPVRAVYPAEAEALRAPAVGAQAGVSLPGFDGQGTKVALLDTGVDAEQAALANRLCRGSTSSAETGILCPRPTLGEAESRRTGRGWPGLVAAVAPGAKIVPIRVVGWQQGKDGSFALTGRGDQLIAGLERAVDPNGNGAVTGRATVALAPLIEAVRRFHRQPQCAPSRARPGWARQRRVRRQRRSSSRLRQHRRTRRSRGALTVGVADSRTRVAPANAWGPRGRGHIPAGPVRILGKTTLSAEATLGVAGLLGPSPRARHASGGGRVRRVDARRFLQHEGREPSPGEPRSSLQTGARSKPRRGTPRRPERRRCSSTERLCRLARSMPTRTTAPDSPSPGRPRTRWTHLREGRQVSAVPAPAGTVVNPGLDASLPFSSRGLSFDGRVKPDVVVAGVGLATFAPFCRRLPRYPTVSGSSAAAAVAAGAAALVAQARTGLTASELRAVLVRSAQPSGASSRSRERERRVSTPPPRRPRSCPSSRRP